MTVVRLFNRWVLAFAILAASGCQSTPTVQPRDEVTVESLSSPEAMLDRARLSTGRQAAELFLQASHGFLEAQLTDQARSAYASIESDLLPRNLLGSYEIAGIEIDLAEGDVAAARTRMLDAQHLQSEDPARVAMLKARLCIAEDRYSCAVSELVGLRPAEGDRQRVHDLIWSYLGRAPAFMAAQQAELSSGVEQGWWALKASMLQSFSIADQRKRLDSWRSRWPRHPAALLPPSALQGIEDGAWQPHKVGLLLPLSGPLARAGKAVRDGFISAYLHGAQLQSAEAPAYQVILYDTAGDSLASLYERALIDQVDLLIGPLAKDEVATLNELNPEVPALALNYLDANAVPAVNLLQLGMAIEDEADTMVTRLLEDGAERLLVFHNYDEWSQRAMRRLTANWPFPITVQPFDDIRRITESVGHAMLVDESEQRREELGNLLGFQPEFLPRARQDLDAVVALVNTVEANSLVPALRFHFAQALPVYASSQSVRGAQPDQLRELSGFRVCELPWYLFSDPLYQDMDGTFVLRGNPLSSLYALGVDAFRVSDRLPLLTRGGTNQLLGSTGILSVDESGRFVRELAWGVVSQGKVVALPLVFGSDEDFSARRDPSISRP